MERVLSKNLNIQLIADLAGVSKSSVSRVLNCKPGVSRKMREAVEAVVKEQGYQVNALARALAHGRTYNIALIIPRAAHYVFTNPFFSEIVKGASTIAEAEGYNLMVSTSESSQRFRSLYQDKSCDGILFAGIWKGDLLAGRLGEASLPLVTIGKPSVRSSIPYVTMDDEAGAYAATLHLIERGCTKLAMISGPPSTFMINREKGFRRALKEANIPFDRSSIVVDGFSFEGGHTAMNKLLSRSDRPTGVLAANDLMAFGALLAARESGVRVPADISVVGFGNISLSSAADPPLTTVEVHTSELGLRAASLLLQLVRGENPEEKQIVLPTNLVVRGSS